MKIKMKIATYNIWNENKGTGNRQRQILEEIRFCNADIIGLQEVTPDFYQEYLQKSAYPYGEFRKYSNEYEGLAILSRYPIIACTFLETMEEYDFSAALHIVAEVRGKRFSVSNLHLPWDSAKQKEIQTVAIDRYMHEQAENMDVSIILGDFNGSLNSSVHRYLTGEQTLRDCEAKPYWFELSSTYAAIMGENIMPTLDFVNNPRWHGENTTEIPYAADRIYVMYRRGKDVLKSVELFGTRVSEENGLSASDHYGVVAEMEFVFS